MNHYILIGILTVSSFFFGILTVFSYISYHDSYPLLMVVFIHVILALMFCIMCFSIEKLWTGVGKMNNKCSFTIGRENK